MQRQGIVSFAACVALLASCLGNVHAQQGSVVRIWDVRDTNQTGQMTMYNADDGGSALGMPVGSGDVNGDGFDDVVLCAFYGPAGPGNSRRAAGKLHLYFGSEHALDGGLIYDAADPPSSEVEIWGARADDFLGNEVDVGDVNGDGYADILACAQNADGFDDDSSRSQAGMLYVILGGPALTGPINLANPPQNVIQVLGAHSGDRCGFWATSGDVNGDGIRDILVSADLAKGSSGTGNARGVLYIIPGRTDFPGRIDLGNDSTVRNLGITTVYGIDDFDHLGSSIASGDFDGDGIPDVAVSAGVSRAGAAYSGYGQPNNQNGQGGGDGPNNNRSDAGEAYILFGRTNWPASIQLADPPPNDVTIFYGDQPGAVFGEDLRAGDVDGDGKDELGVGALLGSAPGRPGSGIGYIFWSGSISRNVRIDAANAGADQMTKIYGEARGDIAADSILLADIDADGYADVLFGSPLNSPGARSNSGDLKVLFGSADRFPGIVDTANPPFGLTIYQMIPADPGDLFTYSLTVGDVNGDGITDLIPNSMGGDGLGNRHTDAGECTVVSGREFSSRAGRGAFAAPTLSRVEVAPGGEKRYYAGQEGIVLSLFSDASDPADRFKQGAVALLRGAEVPTEFVSATELRVTLDDVPEVRNTPGSLSVQVRNPGTDASAAVLSISLLGPIVRKAKLAANGATLTVKIKGKYFLDGATVSVTDDTGADVAVTSVNVRSNKSIRATIARDSVLSGSFVTVTVNNPGPAPSEPVSVKVP